MKRTIIAAISGLLLAAGLAACGEQAQESSGQPVAGTTVRHDTQPWAGDPLAHQAGGFTRGDKASWDKMIDARAQAQNEYVRIGGGAR